MCADRDARPLGFVHCQNGKLRIRVVPYPHRIAPHAAISWIAFLRLFKPLHIAANQCRILLRLGQAEDHRLQRYDIVCLRRDAAQYLQRRLDLRVVLGHTGVEQSQRTQSRDAARHDGRNFLPGTVFELRASKKRDAQVDGVAHLFGGDVCSRLACHRNRQNGGYKQPAQKQAWHGIPLAARDERLLAHLNCLARGDNRVAAELAAIVVWPASSDYSWRRANGALARGTCRGSPAIIAAGEPDLSRCNSFIFTRKTSWRVPADG